MDFGMEKCEVNIHLPALSKLPFTPPSSTVSLYRLESKYVLDTSSLSYAKRPRRVSKLAEIGLHEADNVQWHSGMLECPSESVLTFELACSTSTGSSCNLEWWQDRIPEITSTDAGKPCIFSCQNGILRHVLSCLCHTICDALVYWYILGTFPPFLVRGSIREAFRLDVEDTDTFRVTTNQFHCDVHSVYPS